MKQKVLDRLDRLDRKLETVLDELAGHGQEKLDQKPGPGQWSAMNALHHLRLAEEYAHKYVEKKLSFNPEIPKVGLGTTWRTFLMATAFRSPIKRKAPEAVDTPAFPTDVTIDQLKSDWLAQRKRLADYIRQMDDHWFEKEVYKHPFAGRLSLNGMLTFFETHFDRHLKQARKAANN